MIQINPTTGAQTILTMGGSLSTPLAVAIEADGQILVGERDGIYGVPSDGSESPRLLIPAAEGERLLGPQLLPGGDLVLYSSAIPGDWDAAEVIAQSLETG